MDPFRKEFNLKDQIFVCRFPTGADMIKIDMHARELRNGISEGLGNLSIQLSQDIAMLSLLCEQPAGFDFGKMPFHLLEKLSREVTEWVNSFLDDMGGGTSEASNTES